MNNERSARERIILLIGSLGPLGHLPASGTVTVALIGVPLVWFLKDLSQFAHVMIAVVFTLLAVAVHQVGDRILGAKDSQLLVWDEISGFLIAAMAMPFSWRLVIMAFLIERALDIAKVPPANWIEKRWPGGWGVVGDDVVAGLYTCGLLALLVRFTPQWVGF